MANNSSGKKPVLAGFLPYPEEHYREIKRRQIFRLSFTYLAPLLIVVGYFSIQHYQMALESRRVHLAAIAEHQANTLNLFFRERVINLTNLINSPRFENAPSQEDMSGNLEELVKISETFVDIGYFDKSGIQLTYAGPYPSLTNEDYGSESWFQDLSASPEGFIITDIYLGFRLRPHFTIAVRRTIGSRFAVLRATLDPEKTYAYIRSLEGAGDVLISIVNKAGEYQLVTPHIGTLLENSSIVPPSEPRIGTQWVTLGGDRVYYAYSWLRAANWALIVQAATEADYSFVSGANKTLFLITAPLIALIGLAILNRSSNLVEMQKESDRTHAQLEHASKLASVGELAAGIAHEINNPLAVINEEAGLIKDLMNPEFGDLSPREELVPHLEVIEDSVLRCRNITHKLLGFVRKTSLELRPIDIHAVIEDVVDGLLGRELAVSNIEIIRKYSESIPPVLSDQNQLQQVFLNILNNAIDALDGQPGQITLTTRRERGRIRIAISDTGKGMTEEQLGKIFIPFYTTKEVGKGTGLGLSVSHGIIEDLGGEIEVESEKYVGSTFTITLPIGKSST